ncbi:MAG: Gfo/Idh/MocA family protein [Phycisphaerae bacterium]
MDKVKLAVAGGGAISQRRHLPEAMAHEHVEIVAICDPRADRVATLAEKYDAEPYTDFEKMLKEVDCDAVVVATPNADHCPQALAALAAGKHVLVEKPMATTREEAKAMIEAAKKAGKYLMVGMNQRLMPPHVKAREILATGRLGDVLGFETTFKHPGPDGWSVDGRSSWFFVKDRAVMGVCGDLGIHKADLMRYLLQQEFTHVTGFVGTVDKKNPDGTPIPLDDNAYLTLKTDKGTIGTITISWTHYGRFEDNGTTLYCRNGVMRLGQHPEFGVMVDFADGSKERHIVGKVATNTSQVASGVMDEFVDCLRTNTPPRINGDEGWRALNVILSGIESSKTGSTVELKY